MPLPPHDALILGGGLAGLAAGVRLCQLGKKPLVLEAAKTPGGRARSFTDLTFGTSLDNGPHVLLGAYEKTLRLLDLLGTRPHLRRLNGLDFWTREEGFHRLRPWPLPTPLHLLGGLLRFPPLKGADIRAALRLGRALRSPDALEEMSVAHWLEAHRQTGEINRRLWHPLCLAALNEPAGSANAALFAAVLKRAFLSDRRAGDLLLPELPLSQLLANPAAAFIAAHGGRVLCRSRVADCRVRDGRLRSFRVNGERVPATVPVIAALPPRAARRLLPKLLPDTPLQEAPIISVHLRYDIDPTRPPLRLPAPLTGLPFEASQWLVDYGRLDAEETGRFAAVLSGAYREEHQAPDLLVRTVHTDLARLIPELAAPPLRLPAAVRVVKERRATFAAWPGSSAHRPGVRTRLDNLVLAGDWTATGLPATLEGAVQSGVTAAEAVFSREA